MLRAYFIPPRLPILFAGKIFFPDIGSVTAALGGDHIPSDHGIARVVQSHFEMGLFLTRTVLTYVNKNMLVSKMWKKKGKISPRKIIRGKIIKCYWLSTAK
jgi:hypothetical protein